MSSKGPDKTRRQEFSTFFFLRSYAAIVAGILLIALGLDSLLARLSQDSEDDNALKLQGSFAYMQEALKHGTDDLDTMFGRLRQDFTRAIGYPVELFDSADFAGLDPGMPSLADGSILSLYDGDGGVLLFQQVPNTDRLIAIGPVPAVREASHLEGLFITAYYLLVAILVFLWIKPFYRDLVRLRAAASEFGKDDFSARVSLDATSSILPVAQSFNTMAERIQYLISSHKELTNAVSHELRTPLARFKFSLEILSKTKDEAKKQEYIDNMRQDVRELETLVDEMLGYARLSEQNLLLTLVEIDLRGWIQDIVGQYHQERVRVDNVLGSLPMDGNYRASLNPDLMARAVHNIIRNGLRYAHSSINLCLLVNEDTVTLKICDDGPGIPEDKKANIFEPFYRLDSSRDRQSGGYGLGLAIAARILKQHQGSIQVENASPNGACFTLQWPRGV